MPPTMKPADAPERQPALDQMPMLFRARLSDLKFRDATQTGDGSFVFSGHAAVFDQTAVLYSGTTFAVEESIAPGAFDAVLASGPDVHLNIGHDMTYAMARTGVSGRGGMVLSADAVGLAVEARINSEISFVRDLGLQMEDGVVDQMSFMFYPGKREVTTTVDESGFETDHIRMLTIRELFDVCVCAQGAYPQTDANLRSVLAAAGRAGFDPTGHQHRPSLAEAKGADHVVDAAQASGVETTTAKARAAAQARARSTRNRHRYTETTWL